MISYSQFILENDQQQQPHQVVQPTVNAPEKQPVPNTPAANLDDLKKKLTDLKNRKSGAGTDALTLKIQSFRGGQAIDIKLKPNIEIKAQVEVTGKKKYCKLLKSNIEELSLLQKQSQPADQTKITDTAGNPIKSESKQLPVYFQTFTDPKNKALTWFYFYNDTSFVSNKSAKPIFSKTYQIISVG